eukprot:EC124295.1.p1 GENE.EC124295.1~~EC124295.1.p1  ORF type:complete len:134 (-),score=12.50 EC124295.1:7-408(-)
MLDIQNNGEHLRRVRVRLANDFDVVFPCVETNGSVELRPLKIIKLHRGEDGEEEESAPPLCFRVVQPLRLGSQKGIKEIAVAVLVLAPGLEVLENSVNPVFRVSCEMPIHRDVPPIPNLLRKICRVHDELPRP